MSDNNNNSSINLEKNWIKLNEYDDLTDDSLNVSGRVGYGGGAFTVSDGHVYFSADGTRYDYSIDNQSEFNQYQPETEWILKVNTFGNINEVNR